MTTFLLDTDIVSYLADPESAFHSRIVTAVAALADGSTLAISTLTLYELAYGYVRGAGHLQLLALLRGAGIATLPPTDAGAEVFARMKDAYRRRTGIREPALARHNVDLILASTAVVRGAVLVSNDGIFRTLAEVQPQLIVENWAR